MINRVRVTSQVSMPAIPVGSDIHNDPVQFRGATGLEPVKAELASTPYATRRGAYFQGSGVPSRNIVMTFGLNPNWRTQTVSSLRKLLYGYFMPEQWCKLRFETDDYPIVDIEGICESIEPNIFSADPEMQVSIICHQPDFVDPVVNVIRGIVPAELAEEERLQYEFKYEGTIPTGFTLRVRKDEVPSYAGQLVVANNQEQFSDVASLSLVNIQEDVHFRMRSLDTARDVSLVDEDDGIALDILAKLARGSAWPKLRPGINLFSVGAAEPGLRFELIYFDRYGGL